jgi:hypothetical protein
VTDRARLVVDHTWYLVNKHAWNTSPKGSHAILVGPCTGSSTRCTTPTQVWNYLSDNCVWDGFYRAMVRLSTHWLSL